MRSGLMGARRRGRWAVAALAAVLAVSGGGYAVLAQSPQDGGRRQDAAGALPPATAPVTRGDLSSGLQVDGTLGYAQERRLSAPGAGVLTWVAGEGSAVERDGRLFEVNGKAVRLMYGAVPMYRALKAGDKGEDVRQLKRNLIALGYGTGLDAQDGTFTAGTATAVKRWQKAHKAPETGEVAREDIAFASGPQRVKRTEAALGDEPGPGKPVLTVTGTERIVRFQLDAAKAGAAKTGDKVTVRLPGGGSAAGKVDSVGGTAGTDEGKGGGPGGSGGSGGGGGGGGGSGDKKAKVDVSVVFDDPGAVKGPEQSPVSVELTGETRTGVLSVPVNALLALPGGGFGVQVVEDGRAREVRVELGMFGRGRVEVGGGGLAEGMRVGVPKL
ncbi:peptidoglycan-binding domain-containing protein [Streptomyces lavendulae]|uniref:peptidoglycan-binding domain-containing protein n=1 Tax=Streptomyces lavendulae TaxID=1914 RepID=UPI0024A1600C|nr:peptidoglycan-binding domain-containing protein [Streptomyces lavendulae]GLX18739.1 peptidoglycan-binding protein [Streptomyces lavendulae subsp. lavendulae]GLX29338.1 peptidoglycan-binding protein [Streptomyces lavendulae subsp. lavendulae]